MAFRALRPLARQLPLAARTPAAASSCRFLNTETAPSLYAAHATVTGNRNGHVEADNIALDLAMPKGMGGKGGATNPEELFAAGYGACFQSAMAVAAPMVGVSLPDGTNENKVETTVHLVGDMKKADLGIRVEMKVKVKGISQGDLEKVVEKTKGVCPYSRATEGNVYTNITCEAS